MQQSRAFGSTTSTKTSLLVAEGHQEQTHQETITWWT